ncbi:hypothetical protein [Peptoclostridium acidaminophilum]|nr:hypothetical protein [Peptoclostridium acidaminophilum]
MNRKEIVKALEEYFNIKAKYLGPPSFAYEVEAPGETYTLDTEGLIKNSRGEVVSLDRILNEEAEAAEQESSGISGVEVALLFEGHTGGSLRNLVNMLSSKQRLIARAFNLRDIFIAEGLAEKLSHKEIVSIEDFKEALLEVGEDGCPGISFDFENGMVVFRLMIENPDREKLEAFTVLMDLVNKNAKALKHSSFKLSQDDNPKYALRTWLIRLGMNGSEYKTIRKTLLANLEGSGAFRTEGGRYE